MLSRLVPGLVASGLFAVAVSTSGGGWFEDARGETLAKALLATCLLIFAAAVLVTALWVIGAPLVRGEWLLAAALVLAAPVDVVRPLETAFDVRVSMMSLLDAALITAGVTDGPRFAYQDGVFFPGGDGWWLPHWPLLQFVFTGAIVLALACA